VGTVAPEILRSINSEAERISAQQMSLAVSITALFSGLFIVVMGGLADKIGRVKIALLGLVANIVGSFLVVLAAGAVALPLMLAGRAVPGILRRMHHAGDHGAGEDLLGRRRSPARGVDVVDRLMGRLRRLRPVSNTTFTGATISNFILNATIGLLIVSQQMLQRARPAGSPEAISAWGAGLLTLGYAVTIIAFIRVGEKLLQRFGPRKPMIWGSLIVAASCLLLTPTWVLLGTYKILAVVAYALFGLGLGFYATPSTDAALSNLPADQAGAGAGIYKMASSLGGAIGAALSLAIFTALLGTTTLLLGNTVVFTGIQTNVDLRQAGMVVMLFNLLLVLGAILSIVMTVPKGGGSRDLDTMAASPGPAPQLPLDDERQAILNRLAVLPTADLLEIEKQLAVNELAKLDPGVLHELVAQRRR
jgi:MFS family permease